MNSRYCACVLLFVLSFYGSFAFAEDPQVPVSESETGAEVDLDSTGLQNKGLQLTTPFSIIDDSAIKAGVSVQGLSPVDQRNLETLWVGILQHNVTIQYALRQLNMPEEVRRHHKSVMARTMSGLLSGVGMLPYAFGNSASTIGAASVTQNVSSRIESKADKIDPKTLPTDAELVSLSSTVEAVRKDLVDNYFGYKQSLQKIADMDSQRQALAGYEQKSEKTQDWQDNVLSIMQRQVIDRDRLEARQKAELSYLRLERLVGSDMMINLSFSPTSEPETPVLEEELRPLGLPIETPVEESGS